MPWFFSNLDSDAIEPDSQYTPFKLAWQQWVLVPLYHQPPLCASAQEALVRRSLSRSLVLNFIPPWNVRQSSSHGQHIHTTSQASEPKATVTPHVSILCRTGVMPVWIFEQDDDRPSSWIWSNRKSRQSIRWHRKPYTRTKDDVDRMSPRTTVISDFGQEVWIMLILRMLKEKLEIWGRAQRKAVRGVR